MKNTETKKVKEAREYIKSCFIYSTEVYSIMQEVTDNGIFTINDIILFDNETIIDIAEDIKWRIKEDIGYLMN